MKRYLDLYREDTDYDTWKQYCEVANVPYTATHITIQFDSKNVKFEEEEE